MKSAEYNYGTFKAEHYQLGNFPGPKAGEKFIDVSLYTTEGKEVALSQFLDQPLVLESGSITCPMYARCVKDMNNYIKDYPHLNFAVVYVREAHPGERTRQHHSFSDKAKNATRLKNAFKEERTILVDPLDGNFHKTYGLLPNFVYVINTDGIILFRGDWNDTAIIKSVLDSVEHGKVHPEKHIVPNVPSMKSVMLKALWAGGFKSFWDIAMTYRKLKKAHKVANTNYAKTKEPSAV